MQRWLLAAGGMFATFAVAQPLRPVLEPAVRDPFAPPAPPPASAPVTSAASKAPPELPPVPQAPALNLAFGGLMVNPEGKRVVFGLLGNSAITLSAGAMLPNGYQVQEISDTAVELIYPPLGIRASLQIPTAPTFEVR